MLNIGGFSKLTHTKYAFLHSNAEFQQLMEQHPPDADLGGLPR